MSSKQQPATITFNLKKLEKAIVRAFFKYDCDMSIEEEENYHKFIRVLANLNWPAYMNGDYEFHKKIIDLYDNGFSDKIPEAIFEQYDFAYLNNLINQIESLTIINPDRILILKEAVTLYKLQYYYGCVSLLVSQIIGIVKDIETFLSESGIEYDSKNQTLLTTRYKLSKNSDKARVIVALLEGSNHNDAQGEYLYLIGYFRNIIFSDKLTGNDLLTHANRNMIFHGEQLTFGSKEQALKLILCIDSLIWLAEVLNNVFE